MGDILSVLNIEEKNVIDRLASQGVFVRPEILNSYLIEPYNIFLEVIKAIKEVYDTVAEDVANGISSNRKALINEAESRITGLSYGVLGDALDMITYSIDDYLERKRQRQKAYEEADRKAAEYTKKHTDEGNKVYAGFVAKVLPYLHQGSDQFVDALCKAENDQLIRAGLIDEEYIQNIDINKSSQLMKSITDKQGDNTFTVALALKKYPCNIAALVYAEEHGYECSGLTELIHFLGFESKLEKGIKESKKKRFKELTNTIKKMKTGNDGVAVIRKNEQLLDEKEVRSLLSSLAVTSSSGIEKILTPPKLDSVTDVQKYCSDHLNQIISSDSWAYFQNHSVSPIQSSIVNSTADYTSLKKWLCDQLERKIKDTEREYSQAKHKLSKAKTISDFDNVADSFRKLGNYKDSTSLQKTAAVAIEGKKKKRSHLIIVAVLIVIAACAFLDLYSKDKPYRDFEAKLDSGFFDADWVKQNTEKHYDNYITDIKIRKIIAKKLTYYHNNDMPEEALDLLEDMFVARFRMDGSYLCVSESFYQWIIDTAEKSGDGGLVEITTLDGVREKYQYRVYDHVLRWDPEFDNYVEMYVWNSFASDKFEEITKKQHLTKDYKGYVYDDSQLVVIQ